MVFGTDWGQSEQAIKLHKKATMIICDVMCKIHIFHVSDIFQASGSIITLFLSLTDWVNLYKPNT